MNCQQACMKEAEDLETSRSWRHCPRTPLDIVLVKNNGVVTGDKDRAFHFEPSWPRAKPVAITCGKDQASNYYSHS